MQLKKLYLRNFRNYAEAEVEFSPRLNVFYGENAQGKTNLLEAIYLVSTGRSFRTQNLSELIRLGEPFFYLEAHAVRDGAEQTLKLSFDGQTRRLQMDGNSYASFHPLLGTLPSVLYTPQDTDLISGAPALRRRFLNLHLAQSDPLYVHHLARFWRAMKQRNCLLRSKHPETIEIWENEMAASGAYLHQARGAMLEEIKDPLLVESRRLSGEKEAHEMRFHPTFSPATYLSQLQRSRPREKELGATLSGPHRDDLSLWIEGKEARLFASEGQKKTAIAALRLAEWSRLTARIGSPALLGIDDLGLHLDEARQKWLLGALHRLGQVFITTPYLPSSWSELDGGKPLRIVNGTV